MPQTLAVPVDRGRIGRCQWDQGPIGGVGELEGSLIGGDRGAEVGEAIDDLIPCRRYVTLAQPLYPSPPSERLEGRNKG